MRSRSSSILVHAIVISVLLMSVIGCTKQSEPSPSSTDQTPIEQNPEVQMVGANYYVWYDAVRWKDGITDTPLDWYDSSNPEVIDQHILWASEAGIDFFLVEWCGEKDSDTDKVFKQLLNSQYADKMKFAIFYDAAINLDPHFDHRSTHNFNDDWDENRTKGDKFVDDMNYLADAYFNHPNYLKLDGKPFVAFYPVAGWSDAEPYLVEFESNMETIGYDVYAVADVMGWDDNYDNWSFWKTYFDAITGGIMHCQAVIDDPNRKDFLDELEDRITQYRIEALKQGMGFIPPVMAGFDNRDPNNTPIPRDNGGTMRRSWGIAISNLDNKYNIVNVVTFNEWHEGSEIEPSEEYGMFYLNLLKELRGGLQWG